MAAFIGSEAKAVILTWTGAADGNWSNSGNWSPANTPVAGDVILFSGTPTSFSSNVDVSLDFSAVSFSGLTSDMTLSSSNSSTIVIDAMDVVSFADSTDVTVNVKINGLGGLSMATSAQIGTVTLGANNVYFGATIVSFGTLADGIANAYSAESQFTVGASGTVDVNFDETIAQLFGSGQVAIFNGSTLTITQSSNFSGVITGTGGNLEIANDARFDVQGANTYTGNTTIDAASVLAIDNGGSLSGSTTVTGLGVLEFDTTGNAIFNPYITGGVGVVKTTGGTTTLGAQNDYSGNTLIEAGTLVDGQNNAFSANSTISIGNGATLDIEQSEFVKALNDFGGGNGTIVLNGFVGISSLSSVHSILTGSGQLEISNEASLSLIGTGSNSFNGSIMLDGDTSLYIGDGGLANATVHGSEASNVYLINDVPTTLTAILGTSEDSFGLIHNGTAKATLMPFDINQYTGTTEIDGTGTLADGEDNSFSPNSVVTIDLGGTLEADFNETIAGLGDGSNGGSAFVTIASGKTLTLFLTDDSTLGFHGSISGPGALKIDGEEDSSQTLYGANTYTGGTTVANAELDLMGGSINHPAANLVVGDAGVDEGLLFMYNGSSLTDLDATIGNQANSFGLVLLDNSANTWTNNGTLTVGNGGEGQVQISGGTVSDVNAVIANSAGSVGVMQVLNGTWTNSGTVLVGSATPGDGGTGTIDLPSGGVINIASGSGTLTLGNSDFGAALFIGADTLNFVNANAGGILNAAVINGTGAPGNDDLVFNTNGGPETPYYFTKTGTLMGTPVEIDGTIHVAINAPVVLSDAFSTYSGGTAVTDFSELILGASSSGGVPDSPAMGPIGTGTLTLGDGVEVDLSQSLTLDNTITLSSNGDSTTTFGNSSSPHDLTLNGTITGNAQVVWAGEGILTLSNPASTFSGGISVDDGTLNLTASSGPGDFDDPPSYGPAGTGTIILDDGTILTRPNGATLTINNSIRLTAMAAATISGDQMGLFALGGNINDTDASGTLNILGPVDLTGIENVERTFVKGTTLDIDNDNGDSGSLLAGEMNATINFESPSPMVNALELIDSTANFNDQSGGGATIGGIVLTQSTINFANDSNPQVQGLQGDSDSVIDLSGSGTNLIFDNSLSGSTITFLGTIGGTGSINIGGTDMGTVVELNGDNTYLGPTTITTGNVGVAGADFAFGGYIGVPGNLTLQEGASIVVKSGVTVTNPMIFLGDHVFIGGEGTLAPVSTPSITIQNGSVVTGGTGALAAGFQDGFVTGNSIGTLTFASTTNVTFAQGGVLQFSIMNDTGTAGVDFSTVNVNGTLNIASNTSATPFVIQLVGVDGTGPYDQSATSASFNFSTAHSWTLLSAGLIVNPGGIFDASDFMIDSSMYFDGPGTGTWFVSESGNNLQLNFSPVPEPSTWALIAAGTLLVGFLTVRKSRAKAS
ncbi:MAG TPA: autotransporter-associated beta strand repeat-containing protein [Opitutaceae bacterium]|nr:autotransporter-associated beta strand repeat-containing protein [Opitutaceae bacterium]